MATYTLNRMPVTSLWLDILQKIKAAGYNSVSFYVNWGLIEAKPGEVRAEGIFALEPLFEAAEKAGLYLFAVSIHVRFPTLSISDWCQ